MAYKKLTTIITYSVLILLFYTTISSSWIGNKTPQNIKNNQLIKSSATTAKIKNNSFPESTIKPEKAINQNLALIIRIIDGDTVVLENGSKVRLIGIDTPELGECYFEEAKNKLSSLILNKKVKLEKDVSETDKYQRLLRYIYLDDVFINDYMVLEGYAHATSYPPDVKFQDQFRESAASARKQNKGLWGSCSTPTPIVPTPSTNNGKYVCNCSKNCSQMSSCEEAYYQLNSCGCSRRDGDNDGIPCEKICR